MILAGLAACERLQAPPGHPCSSRQPQSWGGRPRWSHAISISQSKAHQQGTQYHTLLLPSLVGRRSLGRLAPSMPCSVTTPQNVHKLPNFESKFSMRAARGFQLSLPLAPILRACGPSSGTAIAHEQRRGSPTSTGTNVEIYPGTLGSSRVECTLLHKSASSDHLAVRRSKPR